jgi:DNA topoisomerase VI subunit B
LACNDKPAFSRLQRWGSGFCLLLLLVFTAAEAVHVHSNTALSGHSRTPCLICISTHSNAPALTARPLPVLVAVASIAIPYETEAKGIASRLELFTRPPPLS